MDGDSAPIEKALILVLSVLLIIQCYYTRTTTRILEENPEFMLLEPFNVPIPNVGDKYGELLDIKNFTFLLNSSVCDDYKEGLLLLIIVSSKPSNVNYRELIRNTWGKPTHSTKLIFLMGIPPEESLSDNTTLSEQILKESARYGDIVQGTFLDSYRNMTYKHVMGLKWVAHHCPVAKYVLKSDDDTFVHTRALIRFLVRELSPWGARRLILCEVYYNSIVDRGDSKWAVTKEEYEGDTYPCYCFGYLVLYSQDVVRQLVTASWNAQFFWIDDVFVTGMLAELIKVPRSSIHTLLLDKERTDILVNKGPKEAGRFVFGYNYINDKHRLEVLRRLYKAASLNMTI